MGKIKNLFKYRKETAEETGARLFELTDKKDYGLFNPPMDAQTALIELCHHFLGEDWYSVNPVSQEQINTEIVFKIERRYNIRKIKRKR